MIWNNAELFNIDELVPEEDGFFALRRLKDAKQTFPEDNILFQNKMPHGAELRFRLNGGKAKLVCRTAKGERGRAFVYFGRALLGEYAVGDSPAEVFAEMPVEQTVSRIGREGGSPFGEKIVRVVFDGFPSTDSRSPAPRRCPECSPRPGGRCRRAAGAGRICPGR